MVNRTLTLYNTTVMNRNTEFLRQINNPQLIPINKNWRDDMPDGRWSQDEWEIYNQNEAQRLRKDMATFIQQHNLKPTIYNRLNRNILRIEPETTSIPISKIILNKIFKQIKIVEKKGIINNCFFIAKDACLDQNFTGRLCSHNGVSDFVGWSNHCINWHELADGSVIAFDLTASSNIDKNLGTFDVLLLRGKTLEQLLVLLNDLYGGDWNPIDIGWPENAQG
jgi:hypothetical protein